jgi:hypothetical protein
VNVVAFHLRAEELGAGEMTTVTPHVDGTSLVELARRVELGPASKSGETGLAGAYAGLVVPADGRWQHWYLDDQPLAWFGDGDSCLLGCTCGDAGCWPLTATVTLTAHLVTWASFRTGHRSWDLHALGPFAFDRDQYQTALTRHE